VRPALLLLERERLLDCLRRLLLGVLGQPLLVLSFFAVRKPSQRRQLVLLEEGAFVHLLPRQRPGARAGDGSRGGRGRRRLGRRRRRSSLPTGGATNSFALGRNCDFIPRLQAFELLLYA
jgi:hypothetical protein